MNELDRVSGLLGWDIPTLARLTLEKHVLGFEIYMDNITFGSYKEDKDRLGKIFKGNQEILERLDSLHERINSAPNEDVETEILACEYEQFYAGLIIINGWIIPEYNVFPTYCGLCLATVNATDPWPNSTYEGPPT